MPAIGLTLGFGTQTSFAKGSASSLLSFTVSDTNFAGTALAVTAVSDNPTLIPSDSSHLTLFGQNVGNGQGRSILITPASANVSGIARIILDVGDPNGVHATQTFFVQVRDNGFLTFNDDFSNNNNAFIGSAFTGDFLDGPGR